MWLEFKEGRILFLCKNAHVNSIPKPKCYKLQILPKLLPWIFKTFSRKEKIQHTFLNETIISYCSGMMGFFFMKRQKVRKSLIKHHDNSLTPFFWFLEKISLIGEKIAVPSSWRSSTLQPLGRLLLRSRNYRVIFNNIRQLDSVQWRNWSFFLSDFLTGRLTNK